MKIVSLVSGNVQTCPPEGSGIVLIIKRITPWCCCTDELEYCEFHTCNQMMPGKILMLANESQKLFHSP